MLNLLDTFEIASNEVTKEAKAVNNYLINKNKEMKLNILDFIKNNKGSSISDRKFNNLSNCIDNLENWENEKTSKKTISNDSTYNSINFYKTYTDNFTKLFPNIILNKTSHQMIVSNYLGLSSIHKRKIGTFVHEYYKSLMVFFGVNNITNVLNTIQTKCANILKLSELTPSFAVTKSDTVELIPIFDERTSKFLYEYYLLKIISCYVELTDNPEMIVHEIVTENTEEDLVTTEYLQDNQTRVNFMEPRKYSDTQHI